MEIDGSKLLAIRQAKQISRMKLGSFLGVTYSRVAQLEQAGKHKINPHILNALAKELNVELEALT